MLEFLTFFILGDFKFCWESFWLVFSLLFSSFVSFLSIDWDIDNWLYLSILDLFLLYISFSSNFPILVQFNDLFNFFLLGYNCVLFIFICLSFFILFASLLKLFDNFLLIELLFIKESSKSSGLRIIVSLNSSLIDLRVELLLFFNDFMFINFVFWPTFKDFVCLKPLVIEPYFLRIFLLFIFCVAFLEISWLLIPDNSMGFFSPNNERNSFFKLFEETIFLFEKILLALILFLLFESKDFWIILTSLPSLIKLLWKDSL